MAIKKNLVIDRETHTRYLGSFRGVDFSSDPNEVHDSRFAECVNMYKDYRSGQGQAIETIPGFREIISRLDGEIYGIHVYEKDGVTAILVHAGEKLYLFDEESEQANHIECFCDYAGRKTENPITMNEAKSTSFCFNNRLYLIDGQNYIYCDYITSGNNAVIRNVLDETEKFVPTTHISLNSMGAVSEGVKNAGEYSQQNILSDKYKSTFVCDGESTTYILPFGCEDGHKLGNDEKYYYLQYENESGTYYRKITAITYAHSTENFTVNLYGVIIPYAAIDGTIPYEVDFRKVITNELGEYKYYHEGAGSPIYDTCLYDEGLYVEGYRENAYPCITSEGCIEYPTAIVSMSEAGVLTFTKAPPRPEDNRHSGNLSEGDNFAYPEGYAGLEVTAKKTIRTIKGITSTGDVGSIITGCTIATLYDNRVFLSGNPQYPNFVFFNGINPETGYSDPSYFGVLNWFCEGVNNSPIVAMMPIADTLMILRRDTTQDGSVSFRTPFDTGNDVTPRQYSGVQGLPGVGCLGACCNFLDDPIFISKYGVEAMGQLSTRLERAIEHRSSLIDGLLLNLDLSKASIAEYEGYLVLLIEGKIFLADSRQRYTHESGVMQYEWFYLDDIGIYEGQYEGYKYARFPEDYAENSINASFLVGEVVLKTVNIIEAPPELIGTDVVAPEVYQKDGCNVFCKGVSGEYYYAEPTGSKVGGTFDPAVIIKTIGDDLYFGTRGGRIAKFNFDKRDPNDDYKIPNEYYSFNGRTIRCCIATKLDNCGVPHLNKSTVKKSMVVKMRTFPKSAFKIRVRTNRQKIRDVERLYGGRFDPGDLDFFDLTYETGEKNVFRVREREKKWLEKQLYIVSDEYCRPFALHYVAYDYVITGRYKD